ncbi:unnamed protein product [Tenebrio molitor]|nr:unnamed protein product [Tenebrio molitor]
MYESSTYVHLVTLLQCCDIYLRQLSADCMEWSRRMLHRGFLVETLGPGGVKILKIRRPVDR